MTVQTQRTQFEEVEILQATQDIVDALYRFAAGQDLKEPELFRSAFARDAVLDFTQPAAKFGAEVPVMDGRAVIEGIMDVLAPLDTTHTVTNPRVSLDGDEAALVALVEAQHVRRDDGRSFLLKNVYRVSLARIDGTWLIRRMEIVNVWHEGDPAVLFGESA